MGLQVGINIADRMDGATKYCAAHCSANAGCQARALFLPSVDSNEASNAQLDRQPPRRSGRTEEGLFSALRSNKLTLGK